MKKVLKLIVTAAIIALVVVGVGVALTYFQRNRGVSQTVAEGETQGEQNIFEAIAEQIEENVFPVDDTPASKKGLQGLDGTAYDVDHILYNLNMSWLIERSSWSRVGGSFQVGEEEYFLNTRYLEYIRGRLRQARQQGVNHITVVLLASENEDLTFVSDHPSPYNALNTSTEQGRALNQALFDHIGEYIGDYVSYWVVGNEVNAPTAWHSMGDEVTLEEYVTYYEYGVYDCYQAMSKYNPETVVLVSIDNFWNSSDINHYNTVELLRLFNERVKARGEDYLWGLSQHAYSEGLLDANFLDDDLNGATDSPDAAIITMKNIHVLTDYMQQEEYLYQGTTVRPICLTELGYNAYDPVIDDINETKQAAYYTLAYYIAESNPYITNFIVRVRRDDAAEAAGSLYFGMEDSSGHRREIADVMDYIDTQQGHVYTDKYLSYFGVSSWAELIPGFEPLTFAKAD